MAQGWRYIAQRALTGEFLDLDLPIERTELTWSLSGPGSFRGTITPDTGQAVSPDGRLLLEEWGTFLYAEADGQIRWGGIVISSAFNDQEWVIEAAGFTAYPHGIPYTNDFQRFDIDPSTIVREIWNHAQAYADANLGVTVVGATDTGTKLGTHARIILPSGLEISNKVNDFTIEDKTYRRDDTDGQLWTILKYRGWVEKDDTLTAPEGTQFFEDEPYQLVWWETPDCGTEIDQLAKETPFDYVENHYWQGDQIRHEVGIAYPRAGRRRDDLSFIQGVNIIKVVTPSIDGDDFANEVIGLGAGEGVAAIRRAVGARDGRLRRARIYTDKGVSDPARLDALIAEQLRWRNKTLEINSIAVVNHVNARFGSWSVGDDIFVQSTIPWIGDISMWCRITGWSLLTDDTATIQLARSDSFQYGD